AAPLTLETARIPVTSDLLVIAPPLRGGPWLAANGPSAESGHRRAMIPLDGAFYIAQRFAIDWVKVDATNKTYSGDSLKNSSYYAYGNDALAVADGIVTEVKDSIPENVPGINSRAVPITLETVGGNHVIVDLGGGHFAFYAHLQPGKIRVKLGDRVRRGQVLGLVGNSGNSTEPHLHFHVSDASSPLGSEGVPYAFEILTVVGHCEGFTGQCPRSAEVVRHREMPVANELVRFP
ncbi:MAG TPA: M23 family metallopeptidase, partial [Gemmatimonadaceae bacterium]|nr:M23 family metallopeptidase [Gemmatimonadaceae bacterium]